MSLGEDVEMIRFLPHLCVIHTILFALTGCADTVPVQPVNITGSDLCRIQPEPLTWDVADTAPTIKGVRQFNARWSSRCGSKAKKGVPVS